jgi:hypothetical protein
MPITTRQLSFTHSPTSYLRTRADGCVPSRGPMSRERIVFSIQLGRTISAETWERFLERVAANGRTPVDVIRELIERYTAGEKP